MLKNKKGKRYKVNKLYVCDIYRNIGGEYCFISKEILYHSFFYYINPLTKQIFNSYSNHIGTFSAIKICNIYEFFDISDEILLRGDYLTLEEILKYSKKLENRQKK